MMLRTSTRHLLVALLLFAVAVFCVNSVAYFAWLTAAPPVATPTGSRNMTAGEIATARSRAELWLAGFGVCLVGGIGFLVAFVKRRRAEAAS
jgi:hypothetical protein